jgi:hypothetical protein
MTTFNSEQLDLISDLQDESRQHSDYIEQHLNRINILEAQIQELQELQTMTSRITRLEQQNSNFNDELNNISTAIIPAITSTIKSQKNITSQLAEDNKIIQEQHNEQKVYMQRRFDLQQSNIDELHNAICTLQNTINNTLQTPNTRPRKKPNSTQEINLAFGTQPNHHINLQHTSNENDTMEADEDIQTHPNQQIYNVDTQTQSQSNTQPIDIIVSPNLYNTSPYNSVFNTTHDMMGLSPINNNSPTITAPDNANHHNTIDLTTQSPNQHETDIMQPRNLTSSFPTSRIDENKISKNKDLGNHSPGDNT